MGPRIRHETGRAAWRSPPRSRRRRRAKGGAADQVRPSAGLERRCSCPCPARIRQSAKARLGSSLVHPIVAADDPQLGRPQELAVRELTEIELALQMVRPEIEEVSASAENAGACRSPARCSSAGARDDRAGGREFGRRQAEARPAGRKSRSVIAVMMVTFTPLTAQHAAGKRSRDSRVTVA